MHLRFSNGQGSSFKSVKKSAGDIVIEHDKKILCRLCFAGGVDDELKRFLMIFLQAAKNPANKREIAWKSS